MISDDPDLLVRAEQAIKDAEWNLGTPLPDWSVTYAVSFIRVDEGHGHVCHISNHRSGERGPRTADFIANAPNHVCLLRDLVQEIRDLRNNLDMSLTADDAAEMRQLVAEQAARLKIYEDRNLLRLLCWFEPAHSSRVPSPTDVITKLEAQTDALRRVEVDARLKAFTEIHEHWHFEEGLDETKFDEFLHRLINSERRKLKAQASEG